MIEMNPYYAVDSPVGPVFDVATWSPRKAWTMGCCAFVFGALVFTTVTLAWKPTLLMKRPPEIVKSFHKETIKLQKQHPTAAYAGTGVVVLIGYVALAAACASVVDASGAQYYFRVGPGGLSLCVPHGLDFRRFCLVFKKLRMDLPTTHLADWTIVQYKQLGAMSRNTGNVSAFLKLKMADGRREEFNLDCFREPAHIIKRKIDDALQMVPAQLEPEHAAAPAGQDDRPSISLEEKYEAIATALTRLLDQPHDSSAVIFSHAQGHQFVQFARRGNTLFIDLPFQSLDEKQAETASRYFASQSPSAPPPAPTSEGTTATVARSLTMDVPDIEQGVRMALEIFHRVHQLPFEFPMTVEWV